MLNRSWHAAYMFYRALGLLALWDSASTLPSEANPSLGVRASRASSLATWATAWLVAVWLAGFLTRWLIGGRQDAWMAGRLSGWLGAR